MPGFRYLIMVPGFSFFRAPSRWSVATGAGAGVLAGKGFDRWPVEWQRPGRSLLRLAVVAVCWVGVTLVLIELAIHCTGKPGWPEVSMGLQRVFTALPWKGDPTFATVLAQARQTAEGPAHHAGTTRFVLPRKSHGDGSSRNSDRDIYLRELGEAAALVLLVLALPG